MGFFESGQHDWFDFLQSVGIAGSLLLSTAGFALAIITYRRDRRARQFTNRLMIAENHRELSVLEITHPDLSRVRNTKIDLNSFPLTPAEANFIGQRILHFSRYFEGIQDGELKKLDNLEKDVRGFFSRPLSWAVWKHAKSFQNERFVAFVEECLNGVNGTS